MGEVVLSEPLLSLEKLVQGDVLAIRNQSMTTREGAPRVLTIMDRIPE